MAACLTTDADRRPSAEQLLKMPFMRGSSGCKGEYANMVNTYVEEANAAKAAKKAAAK